MKWKLKARIQRAVAKLPSNLSYGAYYILQRRFGDFRSIDPTTRVLGGIEIAKRVRRWGRAVESVRFLELGTGPGIDLPMALWLCGASNIITVDADRYVREELVFESLTYLRRHPERITSLFEGAVPALPLSERLGRLLAAEERLESLLHLMNIRYLAPADAARLPLESESIDCYLSFTVLQHIRPRILEGILREGKRLLRKDGLFIHYIDFSDQYSHSDRSISSINFLRFPDREWEWWAGNPFGYHNRLRVDDARELLTRMGARILSLDPATDEAALQELKRGFPLADPFKAKDDSANATRSAWVVASPDRSP